MQLVFLAGDLNADIPVLLLSGIRAKAWRVIGQAKARSGLDLTENPRKLVFWLGVIGRCLKPSPAPQEMAECQRMSDGGGVVRIRTQAMYNCNLLVFYL